MRLRFVCCLMAGFALAPSIVSAQRAQGIGLHVGTNGFGVDAGFGGSNLVFRVGASIAPESYFLTRHIPDDLITELLFGSDVAADLVYDVVLPRRTLRAGIDLHIVGPLRLSGGLMYRSADAVALTTVAQSIELGDRTFTVSGTVQATLEQSPLVPYVGIGLGNLTSGFGVYMDIGVSYSSESSLVMTAAGPLGRAPGIDEALQRETDEFLSGYEWLTKLYPTVQLGLKFGM